MIEEKEVLTHVCVVDLSQQVERVVVEVRLKNKTTRRGNTRINIPLPYPLNNKLHHLNSLCSPFTILALD